MNSREPYLRAIYDLTNCARDRTTTSEVSSRLNISDPSASEAIQKLEEDNLVCRVAYKGFTLSPAGRKESEEAKMKFSKLKDVFEQIDVSDPEKEASAVENSISREAVDKLGAQIAEVD